MLLVSFGWSVMFVTNFNFVVAVCLNVACFDALASLCPPGCVCLSNVVSNANLVLLLFKNDDCPHDANSVI